VKKRLTILILGILFISFAAFIVSAQTNTVCCERTNNGAFCQNIPAEECAPNSQSVPTSCDSTSFCRAGTCFDSSEGICMGNTPQLVCDNSGGVWSEESPPQCDLGCCILGDQAAFVSLVRCKKLSADLGLETNYDNSIDGEAACIATVQLQEKGACVYEFEFERTCKFTTRAICEGSSDAAEGDIVDGEFFAGKLCSAEELGTVCGQTTRTTCVDGKDEVYFVDTCGNPANIYDASKINEQLYWTDVISKSESCDPNAADGNAKDRACGNCNYLTGSFCRSEQNAGASPTYGDFICADLNCYETANGKDYRHGESWCVYDDEGTFDDSANTVGSRFYKHICINGKEVLEQCGDQREEVCIEDAIETIDGDFAQAACRVNRWQDCLQQFEKDDCENSDRRDCIWTEGRKLRAFVGQEDPNAANAAGANGICLPKNSPGFNFWNSEETAAICSQGNAQLIQKCEKGLFDGKDCSPSDSEVDQWYEDRANICSALGDCGPGNNWVGVPSPSKGWDSKRNRE
jgi:hypothetical protein